MDSRTPAFQASKTEQSRHPRLAAFLSVLDDHLRRHHGVIEYTRSPDCIFRIEFGHNDMELILPDGTPIHPGVRIVHLHFWSEQVPPFPDEGPTLRWALQMNHAFDNSLRALASYLIRPGLDDLVGVRAQLAFGSQRRNSQVARIAAKHGFQPVAWQASWSLGKRMRQFGENVLISMIVLAHNADALHPDSLWRGRALLFMTRAELKRRYASSAKPSPAHADLAMRPINPDGYTLGRL